jgi:hypothetical protein
MELEYSYPSQHERINDIHTLPSTEQKGKRRRSRTVFTAAQLKELERVFEITHHPNIAIRKRLSEAINTPETTIQVQFPV